MSEELTPRQQILLWDLIARGGTALQKDLKPEVTPIDRKQLEKVKLIRVSKERNAYRLFFNEEAGWAYLRDNSPTLLKSSKGSIYDRSILQFVLEQIVEFSRINHIGPGEVIHARHVLNVDVDADVKKVSPSSNDGSDKKATLGDGSDNAGTQNEIRNAFFKLAGRPPVNQVRLRSLREYLSHIPRSNLDEALVRMRETKQISLSKLSNPPDIAAEGDASLKIKSESFHTIWIDP